jgi:hypothetical protein
VSFLDTHFHGAVEFERSAFLGEVVLRGALLRSLLFDQSLPGGYRLVVPPHARRFLYWTVIQIEDESESSAPLT